MTNNIFQSLLTIAVPVALAAPMCAQAYPQVQPYFATHVPLDIDYLGFNVRPGVLGQNRESMIVGYVSVSASDTGEWAKLAKSALTGIRPVSETASTWLSGVRSTLQNQDVHIDGTHCTIPATNVEQAIGQIDPAVASGLLADFTRQMFVATGAQPDVFDAWPNTSWPVSGNSMPWHASHISLVSNAFDTELFVRHLLASQIGAASIDDGRINLIIQLMDDGLVSFELHACAIEFQNLPGASVMNQTITMSKTTPIQLQLPGLGDPPTSDFFFRYAVGNDYFYPGLFSNAVFIEPAVLPPLGYTPDYHVMVMRADNTYDLVPAGPATGYGNGIEFVCPSWAVDCYAALLDMNTGQPIPVVGPNGSLSTFGLLVYAELP